VLIGQAIHSSLHVLCLKLSRSETSNLYHKSQERDLLFPFYLAMRACCPSVSGDFYFKGCFPSPGLSKLLTCLGNIDYWMMILKKKSLTQRTTTELGYKVFHVPFPQ
jgi:hypothetical protein